MKEQAQEPAEPKFMRVDEVAELLGISASHAYKIMRKLNRELSNKAKLRLLGEYRAGTSSKSLLLKRKRRFASGRRSHSRNCLISDHGNSHRRDRDSPRSRRHQNRSRRWKHRR
jgi:hypothetical protein